MTTRHDEEAPRGALKLIVCSSTVGHPHTHFALFVHVPSMSPWPALSAVTTTHLPETMCSIFLQNTSQLNVCGCPCESHIWMHFSPPFLVSFLPGRSYILSHARQRYIYRPVQGRANRSGWDIRVFQKRGLQHLVRKRASLRPGFVRNLKLVFVPGFTAGHPNLSG